MDEAYTFLERLNDGLSTSFELLGIFERTIFFAKASSLVNRSTGASYQYDHGMLCEGDVFHAFSQRLRRNDFCKAKFC